MASVTITIPNSDWASGGNRNQWTPPNAEHISLGTSLSEDGITELFLGYFAIPRTNVTFTIHLSDGISSEVDAGPDFSTQMENSGTITIIASDSSTVTITGIADSAEPYSWIPSNIAAINTFAIGHNGLSDRSITVTFNDNAEIAPSFVDNTGDAQSWTQNEQITSFTVPEADGTPTPTYSTIGALPTGISFNTTTRVISGTPSTAGSGTIRINATNSEGNANWTVAYTITAASAAPVFTDNTGDGQTWERNTAITPITVPAATGNPSPTYAVVGNLPNGLSFNTSSRVLSGSPSVVGSGTIRIRATNSQGSDDWTMTYVVATNPARPSAPTVTVLGGVAVELELDLPNDNNSPITSHTYRYREQGTTSWTEVVVTTTTQTVFGLDRETTYEFQSLATNTFGNSNFSLSETGTTTAGEEVSVTVPDSAFTSGTTNIRWLVVAGSYIDIGRGLSEEGVTQFWGLFRIATTGQIRLRFAANQTDFLSVAGPDFNAQMESMGAITARLSNGHELVLTGIGDATEPYEWIPTDTAVLTEFRTQVLALTDQSLTLTFRDDPPALTAPSFADGTGNAQNWTQSQAITPITVPEADGMPAPTYAAVGNLPTGISFNTTTRVLSGSPSVVTSGTITIRATNSAGSDDWTVGYTTTAGFVAPSFSDPIGDAQSWTQDTAISAITVPAANGNPTPAYTSIGALPAGIAFNTTNRVISGTPTATGSGTIRIRATNSQGSDDWTVTYAVSAGQVAPVFSDDIGNAQNWTQNQAIAAITVPAATGNPTPAYTVVGGLPTGISFSPTTRRISGTPSAVGSGTIRIRATNSQGSDDWTVTYTTTAGAPQVSVTVPLTGLSSFNNFIRWSDNQSLGSTFSASGAEQFLTTVDLNNASPSGQVYISIVGTNNRFTTAFEATGRIIFEASDGETLEVMIADADMTEPYTWVHVPSISAVVAFVLHVKDLVDQTGTLTLIGEGEEETGIAPSFTDGTGNAQTWTQNQSIAAITVPEADGTPTPTYAAVGSLPTGIAFNTTTRVLSGTPSVVGSGTITIRATNSEGSDDWTVDYTTNAPDVAPSFTDDMGTAQSWTQNQSISFITVPAANGNPTPTYAAVGNIPAGINFNTTTRRISGTPTAVGSGTITIRASNSEGSDDWTVDYTTTAAQVAPSFADVTGDAQSWTQNEAITPITAPEADGTPTPVYSVIGNLPTGIAFNATTRVISGTPSAVGSGTIRINATNSEGNANWSFTYTTVAGTSAPSFTDSTGDAQTWTQNVAITSITVPAATGNPTPTYATVGNIPSGISSTLR